MNNKLDKKARQVLEFWFGELTEGLAQPAQQHMWYAGGEDIDQQIRARFGDLLHETASGQHREWAYHPKGRLALIVLFDQFTRHIHRGQAAAFAYDHLALTLCQEGLALGHDKSLQQAEKGFFYLPLEHAQDLVCQDQAVALFEALLAQALDAGHRQHAQQALAFARQHRDIIARFGRFPHRNAALGRASTKAELRYLAQGGQRFGQ